MVRIIKKYGRDRQPPYTAWVFSTKYVWTFWKWYYLDQPTDINLYDAKHECLCSSNYLEWLTGDADLTELTYLMRKRRMKILNICHVLWLFFHLRKNCSQRTFVFNPLVFSEGREKLFSQRKKGWDLGWVWSLDFVKVGCFVEISDSGSSWKLVIIVTFKNRSAKSTTDMVAYFQ